MGQTSILSLPNEILISIFERKNPHTGDIHRGLVPSLRLTCRRFCDLSSHLLLKQVHVDISQPDTLTRLQGIAAQSNIARGVKEVYVRLHFYHPWVAASFGNFVESVESGWRRMSSGADLRSDGLMNVDQIIRSFFDHLDFYNQLDSSKPSEWIDNTKEESPKITDALGVDHLHPRVILADAYQVYQSRFEAQNRIMSSGVFTSILTQSLAKLVNFTILTLHDRELNNNWNAEADIAVDYYDYLGQEKALIRLFSRPMIWEDARWMQPQRQMCDGVPIELLLDIPLAIGNRKDIIIDYFSIQVSAAPDYNRLPSDQVTLASLSAAMEQMSVFQLAFTPPCDDKYNLPMPDDENPNMGISMAEVQTLDQYIGALLNCSSISHAEINLTALWSAADLVFGFHVSYCLGKEWFSKSGSDIQSIWLEKVPLTMQDIGRFVAALPDNAELSLCRILLQEGTWEQTLDLLQRRKQLRVTIDSPLGAETNVMPDLKYRSIFGRDDLESLAEKYVNGKTGRNPFL